MSHVGRTLIYYAAYESYWTYVTLPAGFAFAFPSFSEARESESERVKCLKLRKIYRSTLRKPVIRGHAQNSPHVRKSSEFNFTDLFRNPPPAFYKVQTRLSREGRRKM